MGDIIRGPYLDVNVTSVDIDGTDTIDIDAGTGLLSLDSANGSITMGTSLVDDKTLTLGPPGATQMVFAPSNTASSEKISLTNTSGTAANAIQMVANAGGVVIEGGISGGTAVEIDSATGSITIGHSLADTQTLKLGKNGATEMIFTPHGTASSEKISLTNTAGTANDAISLQATAGGITLNAPSGVIIGPESATAPAKILFKENSENGSHAISLVGQGSVADITVVLPATAGTLAHGGDLALKANIASPTFTGVPAAPTAAAGTDTTQVATTAFVKAAIPSATVATNIALHDQGTDTSCHVVFSSDKAPLEDDITVNKATYANNSITRAIYDDSGQGYKSQVLFPVSSPGYARIDFRRPAGFLLYAGLVLNTYSPVANDTATGYSDLYAINVTNTMNVRIYHEDGIQDGGATYTTATATDVFSVVYDGGHGSSTSGTVMFMKNGVDLGATKTGLASDLIFHAEFEEYFGADGEANRVALVTVDNISFHAAPTVHTSEHLIYNSSTGELAANSFKIVQDSTAVGQPGSLTLGVGSDAGLYVKTDDLYIDNVTSAKSIIFRGNIAGGMVETARLDGSTGRFKVPVGGFDIAGTQVTATAAELNILDETAVGTPGALAIEASAGDDGVLVYDKSANTISWKTLATVCFLKGTKITLSDGQHKNIEEIKENDNLLSYRFHDLDNYNQDLEYLMNWYSKDYRGTNSETLVKQLWENETTQYYIINDKLKVTPEHLLFIRRNGNYEWYPSKNVKKGFYLLTSENNFEEIVTIELVDEKTKVYNLKLQGIMNYYASDYLVHCSSKCDECENNK